MLDLVDEATLCLEPVAPCLLPHDFVVGTDLDLHTNADKLLGVGMGELLHLTSEDRVVGRLCEQGVEEPVADVLVGLGEPLHEVGGDLGLGLVDGVLQQLLGEVLPTMTALDFLFAEGFVQKTRENEQKLTVPISVVFLTIKCDNWNCMYCLI